jgi:hypothetical protein
MQDNRLDISVDQTAPQSPNAEDPKDPDESSRVPDRVEYYSGTILTFLIIAVVGFSIGAVAMMFILG